MPAYVYRPNGTPVCVPTASARRPPPAVTATSAAVNRGPRVARACVTEAAKNSSTVATVRLLRPSPDTSG